MVGRGHRGLGHRPDAIGTLLEHALDVRRVRGQAGELRLQCRQSLDDQVRQFPFEVAIAAAGKAILDLLPREAREQPIDRSRLNNPGRCSSKRTSRPLSVTARMIRCRIVSGGSSRKTQPAGSLLLIFFSGSWSDMMRAPSLRIQASGTLKTSP